MFLKQILRSETNFTPYPMPSKIASTDDWLAAAAYRRTIYELKDTASVQDSRIQNILQQVLSFAPSSYNTQPVRITLVTGERHKLLWDTIISAAKPVLKDLPEEGLQAFSAKLQSHKQARGSVCTKTWLDFTGP